MQIWIALLRGVNVGGKNKLPMAQLRSDLEQQGLDQVNTYIQSGNIVFAAKRSSADRLGSLISDAISKRHGFRPAVVLRTHDAYKQLLRENPFADAEDAERTCHIAVLTEPVTAVDPRLIDELCSNSERFQLNKDVGYLWAPDGIGRSKLVVRLEARLKVGVTWRNQRTANAIAQLADKLSAS